MGSNELWAGVSIFTLLGLFGGGVKWLWSQVTSRTGKREEDIKAREKAMDVARDRRFSELEAEVSGLSDRMETLASLVSVQRTAIHLLVAKIARDEPEAWELRQVEQLLGMEFPIFLRTKAAPVPSDMRETLEKIDRNERNKRDDP